MDKLRFEGVFPAPEIRVLNKFKYKINAWLEDYLSITTYIVVSSINESGEVLVSPRGGSPGFLSVRDQYIIFNEDKGNNLFESCRAVQKNSAVGILAIVPGIPEAVRIQGNASTHISYDMYGVPTATWDIMVSKWYYHCGRAHNRGVSCIHNKIEDVELTSKLRSFIRSSEEYPG